MSLPPRDEEQKRKEETLRRESILRRPAPQKQQEQPGKPGIARPKSSTSALALLRSRRLFIIAALAIAVIAPSVYLLLNADPLSGEVGNAGTPAPTVTVAPVEVLLVRQESSSERFKLHFTAREEGYLHLIAPDEDDVNKSPTVFLAGQLLRSGVDFEFPSGDNWIESGAELANITLIFSSAPIEELKVAGRKLGTESERQYLQSLRLASDERRAPEKRANGSVTTISVRPAPDTPLVTEVTVSGKARPVG